MLFHWVTVLHKYLFLTSHSPVINADDYAKIKNGGDKKPVQFLKNGNTSVSVNADNTDEEKGTNCRRT